MSAGASPPRRIRIDEVAAAELRPLRQRVLRPHQRVEDLVFPGDAVPDALHLAAREPDRNEIVGVASWLPEVPPAALQEAGVARRSFRLRGMATAPTLRGLGIGAALLAEGGARLAHRGVDLVWCYARVAARGFYERQGFVARGEVFELPEIGPHVAMVWLPANGAGPKTL